MIEQKSEMRWEFSGDIEAEMLMSFQATLVDFLEKVSATKELQLDFGELDIWHGGAMSALTAAIKQLLHQGKRLELVEPQQLVIHNLYRVGYYPHPGLSVTNLRQDEPYG